MWLPVPADGVCMTLILRRAHHMVKHNRHDRTAPGLAVEPLPLPHELLIVIAL